MDGISTCSLMKRLGIQWAKWAWFSMEGRKEQRVINCEWREILVKK